MQGKACRTNAAHVGDDGTTERYNGPPYLCMQCHPSDKMRGLDMIPSPPCLVCFPDGTSQPFLYVSDQDIPESLVGYEKIRPWLLKESRARGAVVAECRTHWCVHTRGHFVIGPQREMSHAD